MDHYLIARAQKLAADQIHRVNNLIAVYSGVAYAETRETARAAEQNLRAFVAQQEHKYARDYYTPNRPA